MNFVRYILLVIFLPAIADCAWAIADSGLSENQIKAAYLYKFATYVEWPSSIFTQADMPITIGIIGADEVSSALNSLLSNQLAASQKVKIKILKSNDPLTGIQILFVGQSESEHLAVLLENVKSLPVLTVTELGNALETGSIINFIVVDDHIRFEISVPHAERSGLKISARLLSVAQRIETGRPL